MPNTLYDKHKLAQSNFKIRYYFLTFGLTRYMDMLGMAAQPTEHEMHNELIGQLTNGILPLIITLFFAAIFSMLIGYRVVAKRLAQQGMKKGDARAIGQATASLLFLLIAGIYFKLAVLG